LRDGIARCRGVIGAVEQPRCRAEDAAAIAGNPRRERQQPSSVRVADVREPAVRPLENEQDVEKPTQAFFDDRRHKSSVTLRKEKKMKIDLGGISLVARGLLEVDAVGQDLPLALFNQDTRAEIAPAARGLKLRKNNSGVKQAERLAGKMRIRSEVV